MLFKGSSKTPPQDYFYPCHWPKTGLMSITWNKEVGEIKDVLWEVM